MQIDFFKNSKSRYGTLNYFTEKLQEAFRRAHISSNTYDILVQDEGSIVANLVRTHTSSTMGFNVFMGQDSFNEVLGMPHLDIIVDSISYYPEIFGSPQMEVAFVEEDSCTFAKLLGREKVFFLPHAIEEKAVSKELEPLITASKRSYPIVLTASFIEVEKVYQLWQEIFPKKIVQILDEMVEECLASPDRSHLQIFSEREPTVEGFLAQIHERGLSVFDILASLEKVIRGKDRERLLQAIDFEEVHLFSSDEDQPLWKRAFRNKKNFIYHDAVPFSELFELFLKSRVVLNSIPTIKRGYHERIFYALAAGASIVSNRNQMVSSFFPENGAHLFYLSPDYASIKKRVEEATHSEEKRLQDIMESRRKILQHHTWDIRVQQLLKELLHKC